MSPSEVTRSVRNYFQFAVFTPKLFIDVIALAACRRPVLKVQRIRNFRLMYLNPEFGGKLINSTFQRISNLPVYRALQWCQEAFLAPWKSLFQDHITRHDINHNTREKRFVFSVYSTLTRVS